MAAEHTMIGGVLTLVFLACGVAEGATLFSQLSHVLVVSVMGAQNSSANGTKAGVDELHITWSANSTALIGAADDSTYKTVDIKLCFGAPSQVDRAWRKTNNLLSKDKTCLFNIARQPYARAGNKVTWAVTKEIPSALYFVRAYVLDAAQENVAYGQTTDAQRTSNLFSIESISGRSTSIDIAAGAFSAFSVFSLFGCFFYEKYMEKRKTKA